MREILFRAKHIHALPQNGRLDGTWIYGYLCDENHINSTGSEGEFLIDPETVCQYTGLTDKNGRKIFEGDIVKTRQYGVDDGNGHNYAGFDTFSVEFSDGGFCLKNKWSRFNLRTSGNLEVIGNIFDNPELVKRMERERNGKRSGKLKPAEQYRHNFCGTVTDEHCANYKNCEFCITEQIYKVVKSGGIE